ncbi:hypothetical protein G6F60_008686 [Rhizopus arrhizus]|nr:hypothetical protein G6F60_008686 [Rhizopus arrhizus]
MDQLPYEVIKQISLFLNKSDRVKCLTICKAWYKTLLDLIYADVKFIKLASFRQFLYYITHHSSKLKLGVKVRTVKFKIDFNTEYNQKQKKLVFTEFELLARHCPNVTELKFDSIIFWQFLVLLNFDFYWNNLKKLPDFNGGLISRKVLDRLSDRLTTYGINTPLVLESVEKDEIIEDLSKQKKLQSIKIIHLATSFTIKDVSRIIREHKELESLLLWIRVKKEARQEDDVNEGLEEDTDINKEQHYLKILGCIIDCRNHPWITYIRNNFTALDTLSFKVNLPAIRHDGTGSAIARQITRAVILDDILDLFYSPNRLGSNSGNGDKSNRTLCPYKLNLKKLMIDFDAAGLAFLDNYLTSLVCMTAHLYEIRTTTASICVDFVEEGQYSDVAMSSITEFLPMQRIHHAFSIYFPCDISASITQKMFRLKHTTEPIVSFITELTIRDTRKDANSDLVRYHYIDIILDHFTRLDTLEYVLTEPFKNYKAETYRNEIDYKEANVNTKHYALKHLIIKGGMMAIRAFPYILNKCPNLSTVSINMHKYDEESALIFSYLCLERGIIVKEV